MYPDGMYEIRQKVDKYCERYNKMHAFDYFNPIGKDGKATFTMTDGTHLTIEELEALIA